jgi:hypothetical protein
VKGQRLEEKRNEISKRKKLLGEEGKKSEEVSKIFNNDHRQYKALGSEIDRLQAYLQDKSEKILEELLSSLFLLNQNESNQNILQELRVSL